MQYTLKIAAISGENVGLCAIAAAMALHDATAGGTPFHEPTFKGRYKRYTLDLLTEVRFGRLEVCNNLGRPIAIDPGVEPHEDFVYVWSVRLKTLNEWAEKSGDSFSISHEGVGWIDERGHMGPVIQDANQQQAQDQKIKRKERDPLPDISRIDLSKWYSTSAAARFLNVTQKYVQNNLITNKKLGAEKRGGRWYFPGLKLRDYMEAKDSKS